MSNDLREQIFRATDHFLSEVARLVQRHTESLFRSAFSATEGRRRSDGRALGAKRAPSEIDDLAGKFAAFVRSKPGLRIEQINKELGTTTAALALPIRKLIARGDVAVEGEKRSTTYHPAKSVRRVSQAARKVPQSPPEPTGGETAGVSPEAVGSAKSKSKSKPKRARARARARRSSGKKGAKE